MMRGDTKYTLYTNGLTWFVALGVVVVVAYYKTRIPECSLLYFLILELVQSSVPPYCWSSVRWQ